MSFTSAEKRRIRSYLGYSGGFRDRGVRLESMMDVVGSQADEATYARELLGQIADVDDAIATTGTETEETGDLKKVDEIEFYPTSESGGSGGSPTGIAWGEVLIERLRALFDVPLNGRYFRKSMLHDGPFPLG